MGAETSLELLKKLSIPSLRRELERKKVRFSKNDGKDQLQAKLEAVLKLETCPPTCPLTKGKFLRSVLNGRIVNFEQEPYAHLNTDAEVSHIVFTASNQPKPRTSVTGQNKYMVYLFTNIFNLDLLIDFHS